MAAPLLISVAAATVAWGAVPITQVTIDAPGVADVGYLRGVFGVAEGGALSRSELRAGVQALMATGRVEDAVVEVTETPAGAAVRVRVQPASTVRSVVVRGASKGDAKRVLAALGVSIEAPLRIGPFEAALERARAALRDSGYPQAAIEPNLEFDPADASVAVTLDVRLGPPLTARKLALQGAELPADKLWQVTHLVPGRVVKSQDLESARRRLAEYFRREGFWEAEVDSPRVSDAPQGATVAFTVQRGPHWDLRMSGIKRTKALEIEALPFVRGEEPFTEPALDSVLSRFRMYLERDGRLLAKVDGTVGTDEAGKVLDLKVAPGPRTPIVAVTFPGARTVPERKLREKIGASPGRYWRWGKEPVDDETLAADASSLLGVLRDAGLADAKVADARIVPKPDGVEVQFAVEEGSRRTVDRLDLEGVPPGVKQPRLPVAVGGPWSERAEEQARLALEAAIQETGYADAVVTASHECTKERCAVRLLAVPGSPSVIGRVVVAGLVKTRRSVVDNVSGIRAGQVAGPERRLAAQRRLLGLGFFDRVDLHPIPGQDSGPKRGLVLDLKEGPSRAYSYGVGYDTEQKLRLSLTWSELNVFGTGRSLALDLRFSSLERRIQLTYKEPERLGVFNVPTWISVYRTQDFYTDYDVLQRGTWIEFGDHFKRPFRTILRYEYKIVNPNAPAEILTDLERDQQRDMISSITPVLEWDTRDDIFTPRRGAYLSLSFQDAFKFLMADAAFNKLTATASAFVPAQGGVLAFTVRGGGIQPSNPTSSAAENLEVPLNERFFAGGRVSQRAYATDLLGIPGQTVICEPPASGSTATGCNPIAVGGAGMLLASTEWRFPVYGPFGGNIFVDGGNVWQNWRDINVGGMKWGAGVGVRVDTPVGPLRLEYGWKFTRESFTAADGTVVKESPGELFLSFGNPF